jgi:hypothetical protein
VLAIADPRIPKKHDGSLDSWRSRTPTVSFLGWLSRLQHDSYYAAMRRSMTVLCTDE